MQNQKNILENKLRKPIVMNFITKLYQIISNPQYKHIIGWGQNGQEFYVSNIKSLCQQILPKYFKHSNYASFIRQVEFNEQLNMYGFSKYKSQGRFFHEKFHKNKPYFNLSRQLLLELRRKTNNELKKYEMINFHDNSLKRSFPNIYQEIIKLRMKQEQEENIIQILTTQNKQLINQNKNLLNNLKKCFQRNDQKIQNIILFILLANSKKDKNFSDFALKNFIQNKKQTLKKININPIQNNKPKQKSDTIMSWNSKHSPKNNYIEDDLFHARQQDHKKILMNLMNKLNNNIQKRKIPAVTDNDLSLQVQNSNLFRDMIKQQSSVLPQKQLQLSELDNSLYLKSFDKLQIPKSEINQDSFFNI